MEKKISSSRRGFIKSAAVIGTLPFLPASLSGFSGPSNSKLLHKPKQVSESDKRQSIIGHYGPWAASLVEDPALLSFRRDEWSDLEEWRDIAGRKMLELLGPPDTGGVPKVSILKKYQYDGLDIEEMSWQLPYGRPPRLSC